MPKITFSSSPVLEVNRTNGFVSHTTSPMDNVLPPDTVECAGMPEVVAAFDAYCERIKATGQPAAVVAYFPRQAARKPRGFDAANLQRYVNTEAMEAAANG